MRQYETTFIIDAHLPDDVIEKIIEKFRKLMEEKGAKIQNIDRWGKRRLAYEITRKQYGYYVYVRFEAEATFIKELEREYKLDDSILRYITVVVPVVAFKQEERDAMKRSTEQANAFDEEDDSEEIVEEAAPEPAVSERVDTPESEGQDEKEDLPARAPEKTE